MLLISYLSSIFVIWAYLNFLIEFIKVYKTCCKYVEGLCTHARCFNTSECGNTGFLQYNEEKVWMTNTGFCLKIHHHHHHFTLKAPAIVTQQLLTRDKWDREQSLCVTYMTDPAELHKTVSLSSYLHWKILIGQ